MASFAKLLIGISPLLLFVSAYHTRLDNTQFHCWFLDGANKANGFACQHVEFVWLGSGPPLNAIQGSPFTVQYGLRFDDGKNKFFSWLMDNGWLDAAEGSLTKANEFCDSECGDVGQANEMNCCVHLINVQSCPTYEVLMHHDVCGPWIEPLGSIFVRTPPMAGKIEDWSTEVVLDVTGENVIIAHIQVGGIQMALGQMVMVHPKANCGDGFCDEMSESCESCVVDCCPDPEDTDQEDTNDCLSLVPNLSILIISIILYKLGYQF